MITPVKLFAGVNAEISFRSLVSALSAGQPVGGQSRGKEKVLWRFGADTGSQHEQLMRDYELIFIVQPELEEAAFEEVVDRVKTFIEDEGGEVARVDPWGKRKLAYPIRKKEEGQYVRMETQMQTTAVSSLERNLRLLEPVMRFLVTAVE